MSDLIGDLQDGLLAHYLEQAKASDVNVEARIEREPFDFRRDMLTCNGGAGGSGAIHSIVIISGLEKL